MILDFKQDNEPGKLICEIAELEEELTINRWAAESQASNTTKREETQQPAKNMADLETTLQEIWDFHRENFENLTEIEDDIKKTNNRIDDVEKQIVETEQRTQNLDEATLELMELQKQVETRMMDLEGCTRRENIQIHRMKEGVKGNAQLMSTFVKNLLREKLDLPLSFKLKIEKADRALVSQLLKDFPPRSIVMKLQSFRSTEELIRIAAQKGLYVQGEEGVSRPWLCTGSFVKTQRIHRGEKGTQRKEYTLSDIVSRETPELLPNPGEKATEQTVAWGL